MRGEFIGVWPELWNEVWQPLIDDHALENDIFCELYRELDAAVTRDFRKTELERIVDDEELIEKLFKNSTPEDRRGTAQQVAHIIGNPVEAERVFMSVTAEDLRGERELVSFVEVTFDSLAEFGDDDLSNDYFGRLESVINKYSLRYDLRRPCVLCPTISGVFASLMRDIRIATNADPHLTELMKDFDEAVRDLRQDSTESKIRTCMVKQVNLLEAIGKLAPGVNANTIGAICNEVGTWPHEEVKESMKRLYKFTCDYPGIRHAGTPANALRTIEMRDMVSMSIVLVGFLPYLTDLVDPEVVYHGS